MVVGNTGLPEGDGKLSEAFLGWQKFSRESPVFPIGGIVNGGCATDLSPEVIAAYDAPFPDETLQGRRPHLPLARAQPARRPGARRQPRPRGRCSRQFDASRGCARSAIRTPSPRVEKGPFIRRIPGAEGQPHTTIVGGGHFLQEDKGPELAEVIADFIAATPEGAR